MNIGILYPSSKAHPNIAINFMDGIKSHLNCKKIFNNFNLISESVGIGGNEKEVYKDAEKLLIIDDVDILIAFVDEKVVDILSPLINASGKLLIIINTGANIPNNWIPQPNIIRLNLQHAFLCWLTGAFAANTPNAQASCTSTFYDCGYGHVPTMVKNFNRNGGSINFNYINNTAYNEQFNINELIQFLANNPTAKNLLCLFDSLPASLFFKLLNEFERASELNLFVSPMMLQKEALANIDKGFKFSIQGYLPWAYDLDNKSNIEFKKVCTKNVGIFSLLGYETALVLHQILKNNNEEIPDGANIVAQLKATPLQSPRGLLKLDDETQIYLAPVAKCILTPNSTALKMEWILDSEKDWKNFVSEPANNNASGWMNTYLCY